MSSTPKPEARVLVVDDEAQIRRLISLLLRRIEGGYAVNVVEAGSAEEAVQALQGAAFDLVISDYSMPGKTGIDLLEHAHARHAQAGRMLITALAQLDIGVEAINRGHVDAFLRKPWDNDAFVALVHSLLEPRVKARSLMATQPKVAAPPVTIHAATHGPAAPTATRAAGSSAKAQQKAAIEVEMAEVDRQLRQVRVRLGLGGISPDGYQKLNNELSKKKADLEIRLVELEF